jgi:ribose transport system ATP-binding protein
MDGVMTAPRGLALSARGLRKHYPGVHALDGVDLDIAPGEVHALVGQNGAGKSTLIKMLSGAETPDSGSISVDGHEVSFKRPRDALAAGICTIFQELSLVRHLTVAENVMLGSLPRAAGPVISWRRMRREAEEVLGRLGADLDVSRSVRSLTVAQQQLVELAKALRHDARVVLLDEPTATLPGADVERLFVVMRRLQSRGVALIYISHRLEEVYEVAQTITILRDGHCVGTCPVNELTPTEVVRKMVGRKAGATMVGPPQLDGKLRSLGKGGTDEPVLEARDLCDGSVLHDVCLTLHRGEVLGVGGLVGSGQSQLAECLFGARATSSGAIYVNGKRVRLRGPRAAIAHGVGLLPAERKSQGLVLDMSVLKNTTMVDMRQFSRLGVLRRRSEIGATRKMMAELGMKVHHPQQHAVTLSGGTQQKVVLAKWLVGRSKILLFDEPTRGIDVGAKEEIYRLIGDFVDAGGSVLLISSELPEILMCDRAIVLAQGRIAGSLAHEDMDVHGERVLEMFA